MTDVSSRRRDPLGRFADEDKHTTPDLVLSESPQSRPDLNAHLSALNSHLGDHQDDFSLVEKEMIARVWTEHHDLIREYPDLADVPIKVVDDIDNIDDYRDSEPPDFLNSYPHLLHSQVRSLIDATVDEYDRLY